MTEPLDPANPAGSAPLLSIGLPVRNGENFLEETLRSLCGQSFTEFELIIADNGSTDATQRICQEYERRDPRIRYVRHEENAGAAANFNLVLELARAPLFKWQAHDDQLAPDFLARSVRALAGHPDAVLCITGARRVDGHGYELERWNSPLHGTESGSPASRFGAVVRTFYCNWTELYGVMRRDAIARTMLHRPFRGSDIAIMAELALLGPFVRIDAPLFISRDHESRYYRSVDDDPEAVVAWYDPDERATRIWHKWALYRAHFQAIRRHIPSPVELLRCHIELLRSMAMWVNVKGLARDVGWSIDPRLISWQRRLRRQLFGSPPASIALISGRFSDPRKGSTDPCHRTGG
ncbi:MAG: glycosyltransferase family 2 protein [Geminicoccaceae bacterium]